MRSSVELLNDALGIRRAFPRADLAFFERHGAPDEEPNDDRTRVKVEAANAVWSELGEAASRA